ncbi:hypothetical protein ACOME3_002683 [Neoechinorhynchus agilis]
MSSHDSDIEELIPNEHDPVVEVASDCDVEVSSGGEEVYSDDVDPRRIPCDAAIASLETGDPDPNYCCVQFGDHIALGTGNDRLIVWNYKQGNVVLDKKFSDSVTFLRLSNSKSHLAAGDLSGKIEVYALNDNAEKKEENAFPLVWEFMTDELSILEWHPQDKALFGGTIKGDVWLWQVPGCEFKLLQSGFGACVDALVIVGNSKCLVAYHRKRFLLFDLKTQQVIFTYEVPSVNSAEVISITKNEAQTLVAAGCCDGTVCVLSTERGSVLQNIQVGEHNGKRSSVESVLIITDPLSGHDKYLKDFYFF